MFAAETYFFVCHEIDILYLGLVFCATLFIYSIHRIIGISKLNSNLIDGRYKIILKYRSHLKIYGGIALIGIIFFLISSTFRYLFFLVPLGIVSVLYTLPILTNHRRLRDYNYVKIYLIAIVWAGIATGQIMTSGSSISYLILILLFIEKVIYIIAITLPFDIRDLDIDLSLETKTIPQSIGVQKTYRLIYALLTLGMALYVIACMIDNQMQAIPYILIAYAISIIAVYLSKGNKSDYYYSGILDGVIGVRSFVLVFGVLNY